MGLFGLFKHKDTDAYDDNASSEAIETWLDGLNDDLDIMSSCYDKLSHDYSKLFSKMGSSIQSGWGNSWSSYSKTIYPSKNINTIRRPQEHDAAILEKRIRPVAGDDWKKALAESWFIMDVIAVLDGHAISEHPVSMLRELDNFSVSRLMDACGSVCCFSMDFPLSESETERAYAIAKGLFTGQSVRRTDDGDILSRYEELRAYALSLEDYRKLWCYASYQFIGHTNMIPVNSINAYMSSKKDDSVENAKRLADLLMMDVLVESYKTGVPVEDIMA